MSFIFCGITAQSHCRRNVCAGGANRIAVTILKEVVYASHSLLSVWNDFQAYIFLSYACDLFSSILPLYSFSAIQLHFHLTFSERPSHFSFFFVNFSIIFSIFYCHISFVTDISVILDDSLFILFIWRYPHAGHKKEPAVRHRPPVQRALAALIMQLRHAVCW
jgi:hypothetical protein